MVSRSRQTFAVFGLMLGLSFAATLTFIVVSRWQALRLENSDRTLRVAQDLSVLKSQWVSSTKALELASDLQSSSSARLAITYRGTVEVRSTLSTESKSKTLQLIAFDALNHEISDQDIALGSDWVKSFEQKLQSMGGRHPEGLLFSSHRLIGVSERPVLVATRAQRASGNTERLDVFFFDSDLFFKSLISPIPANTTFFVLSQEGRSLAHTDSAMRGADFSKVSEVQKAIQDLKGSPKTNVHVGTLYGLDYQLKALSLAPLPGSDLWLGVEQSIPQVGLATLFKDRVLLKTSALASLLFLLAGLGMVLGFRRVSPRPPLSPSVSPPDPLTEIDRYKEVKVAQATELNVLQKIERDYPTQAPNRSPDRDPLSEFVERELTLDLTPQGIERVLVESLSQCFSLDVAYFQVFPLNRTAVLKSLSRSIDSARIPAHVQVMIRPETEAQVTQLHSSGKMASLRAYGPLAQVVSKVFQSPHFEAWAFASSPEISSGKSQWVGIVVGLGPEAGKVLENEVKPKFARAMTRMANHWVALEQKAKLHAESQPPVPPAETQ